MNPLGPARWDRLSGAVAGTLGLHFPPERWEDLRRGVTAAAQELELPDLPERLLSTGLDQEQLQVLASHLTIGETYFFRDPQILEALVSQVLPDLIAARREEQRLRLWSAACCTGEEPYTLAILLQQRFPELRDWHVTIHGTDLNPRFLRKAVAGVYGEWSFREATPGLKERWFTRTAEGRLALLPELRTRVTFANLNLVEDVYPSLSTDTNALDLIFCRNVLMYFTPTQMAKVVGKLHLALAAGGWLVVSPSEASQALFPQFVSVKVGGAILFQKADGAPLAPVSEVLEWAEVPEPVSWPPLPDPIPGPAPEPPGDSLATAEVLFQEGRYDGAAELLMSEMAARSVGPAGFPILVRALANQGRLAEALNRCDQWIAAEKLEPLARYLRAVVLLELGDPAQARVSLQRALYLRPDFVLAHVALANLARSQGKAVEAERHFGITRQLLEGREPDELLPEGEGLSAGRLAQFIASMTTQETAP